MFVNKVLKVTMSNTQKLGIATLQLRKCLFDLKVRTCLRSHGWLTNSIPGRAGRAQAEIPRIAEAWVISPSVTRKLKDKLVPVAKEGYDKSEAKSQSVRLSKTVQPPCTRCLEESQTPEKEHGEHLTIRTVCKEKGKSWDLRQAWSKQWNGQWRPQGKEQSLRREGNWCADHHKGKKEIQKRGLLLSFHLAEFSCDGPYRGNQSMLQPFCELRTYPYPHVTCKTQINSRSRSKYLDITATCPFSLHAATVDRPALLQCCSICSISLVSCFALPAPLKLLVCLYLPPSPPYGDSLLHWRGRADTSPLWKIFPSPGNCWSRQQVPQDASMGVLQATGEWGRVPWSGIEDHSQRGATSAEGWIHPGTVFSPTVRSRGTVAI